MPDQRGTFVLPQPLTLPGGRRGQLAFVDGALQVHDGTAWAKLAGGGALLGRATVDVGTQPMPEFTAVVTDPNVTVGAHVHGWVSDTAAAGKDADEASMDVIDVWCSVPADGQLAVRLTGMTGFIADRFIVDYLIAKG